jgi:signal transduction histidine kinase
MVEADLRHLHRIRRLIEDMLDISRLRAGKLSFIKERVNFCDFIKDVVERFKPHLDASGCILRTEGCSEFQILVEIDSYRVEQVLVNILTNAIRYGACKPISLYVKKTQSTVKVMVEDRGPGIKEQDLERIFEKFERAISREVSGLGLGLYISRQIIDLHGGSLYATSVVDKGSTFIFELPL